jgi:DNA replication protein DnaD
MKSFKEYSKVENNSTLETEEKTAAEDLTKKIASAYNGKSNAAMLQNILREAEKNKRAGTLSNEEIDKFYESFSPMLDQAQRKRLRAVVERLKNI